MMLRFHKPDYIAEAARLRTSKDAAERRNSEMLAEAAASIVALLDERDALRAVLSTSINELYRMVDVLTAAAFEEGWRAANVDQDTEDLRAAWNASSALAMLEAMPRRDVR